MTIHGDQDHPYVPVNVRCLADELHKATGHKPAIYRLTGNRWRILMENERVRMTYDGRIVGKPSRRRSRRFLQTATTLLIDGGRVPIARSLNHFVAIFKDPTEAFKAAVISHMPPAASPDDAPEFVRVYHEAMTKHVGDKFDVHLGTDGERWTLGLGTGDADIRFHLQEMPAEATTALEPMAEPIEVEAKTESGDAVPGKIVDTVKPKPALNDQKWQMSIQLIIGGVDYTDYITREFKNNPYQAMAQALMAIMQGTFPDETSPTPLTIKGRAPVATMAKSVEVRKTTVFRI